MATIQIKCGVCGSEMHIVPSIGLHSLIEIVATCPNCKRMDKEIGDLEDKIYDLQIEESLNGRR